MSGLSPGIVLCVGEALIALAPSDGRPLEEARVLEVSAAGAELNVAVHLARLGLPARFAGMVGADPWGRGQPWSTRGSTSRPCSPTPGVRRGST
ncbi:MAG: PfkB family carbohydrate kinase [Actinomycetes bacterium]